MNKKFPSLHLNADDFIPATKDEKESLVVMRDSVNFWADGMRRLRKNKIAMISLVFILIIMIFAYIVPSFWPYSYEEQIKYSENLKPFEYSQTEQARIDAGEKGEIDIKGLEMKSWIIEKLKSIDGGKLW